MHANLKALSRLWMYFGIPMARRFPSKTQMTTVSMVLLPEVFLFGSATKIINTFLPVWLHELM